MLSTLDTKATQSSCCVLVPVVIFIDGFMSNFLLAYTHPETLEELQAIIDRGLTESIHLEFKRSDALMTDRGRSEVSKDISALANSDGGVIVYGVAEDDHKPFGR